jgi:molybdopterin converting factor subunit 1
MNINILAFGIVKEIVQGTSVTVTTEGGLTVAGLKNVLSERFPRLRELSSVMIAVNGAYADGAMVINEGDEVAVIPPVSGG